MLESIGTQDLHIVAGNKMPIPYISRALVNDNDITLTLSLYVLIEEETRANAVTHVFSDLYFYVGQVYDSAVETSPFHEYSDVEISGSGTQRAFDLIRRNVGVMKYLVDLSKDNYALDRFLDSNGDGYYLN